MPPRGRPKKSRVYRMDAAVDAMVPLGFPAQKVRHHVRQLLKIYGGEAGWPFIEEYAYKELIDALLRGDEEQGQLLKDEKLEDDAPAEIAGPSCSEPVNGTNNSNAEGVGKGWKDIPAYQTSADIDEAANADENPEKKEHSPRNSPIAAPSPPPNAILSKSLATNNLPTRRRFHCYGWIESDEDDDEDFIILKPATSMTALKETVAKEVSSGRSKSMGKGGSRWDQRPDDP